MRELNRAGITIHTGRVNAHTCLELKLAHSGQIRPQQFTYQVADWGEAATLLGAYASTTVASGGSR